MTPGELPEEVLAFTLDTTFDALPVEVTEFAKRCLLDLLGVAAAGRTTELSALIHRHAQDHFAAGAEAAPILFDGTLVSPSGAALAGGMTIDSIDAHDGNKITKGHTGCHQLPALLALFAAERIDDPREFLAALVVGYEVATRAGFALHATAPDYHTSGAWGAVGVAALGGRVLGLSAEATFHAMGIAEYHGPRSQMMRVIDHPTMLKDGSGWGAMAGVSAAYLARAGFTGAPAVTVNDPATEAIWADLGTRWLIFEQYFKPHPVCRWAQPAVEASLALRAQHDLRGVDIDAVEVHTFHEAARLATNAPTTTEQAQYSLPFPVAAALVRGRLGPEEVTGAALADPDIASLASRVTIAEDAHHNAVFPGTRLARVCLHLRDGTVVTSSDTEPRGDPEAHLTNVELLEKFHRFADPVLGEERSGAIVSAVDGLEHASTLGPLLALIHDPVG